MRFDQLQDQTLNRIADYGYTFPAALAREEARESAMRNMAQGQFKPAEPGLLMIANMRHRLGDLLIRAGHSLQGTTLMAPDIEGARS